MSEFDAAVNYILKWEGGLSDNENDLGGITNFGISLRFLSQLSNAETYKINTPVTRETIVNLTLDQAKAIYYGEFWKAADFASIANQDQCNYIFDMAINMGVKMAIEHLQRATWAVMRKWTELDDDGVLGANTLAAVKQCGFLLMPALRAERAAYYRLVIAAKPSQQANFKPWMNRTYA